MKTRTPLLALILFTLMVALAFACKAQGADILSQIPDRDSVSRSELTEANAPELSSRSDGKVDEAIPQNFRANEFSLDLYAAANARDLTGEIDYGGGLGANYFFTRGFGAGARVTAWNTTDRFLDEISARLIARAPLWDRLAPYGYVEGTYDTTDDARFKDGSWGAGAGGGLEIALNEHVRLKAEAGLRVDTKGRGSFQGTGGISLPF